MRTIQQVLKDNPETIFFCGDTVAVDINESIESYLEYNEKKPNVYVAEIYSKLQFDANRVLEGESQYWEDRYEDWELSCSNALRAKLQSVLNEIVEYDNHGNVSYYPGEQIDISLECYEKEQNDETI